jgi:4-hydroxy-tetrahydrodipicolinate synthase
VASNVAPIPVSELVRAAREGQLARAEQLHRHLYPLFKKLFIESNPAPTKFALSLIKGFSPELRLPLVEMEEGHRQIVRETLTNLQLIK